MELGKFCQLVLSLCLSHIDLGYWRIDDVNYNTSLAKCYNVKVGGLSRNRVSRVKNIVNTCITKFYYPSPLYVNIFTKYGIGYLGKS